MRKDRAESTDGFLGMAASPECLATGQPGVIEAHQGWVCRPVLGADPGRADKKHLPDYLAHAPHEGHDCEGICNVS